MSHAVSAFFPSPYEEATIVIIDGVGEWSCTTVGYGRKDDVKLLAEQRFPHSIGLLYSSFTQYLGFKVDSGEYKVMGLAPYGEPRYVNKIKKHIVSYNAKGEIKLHLEKFDFLNLCQFYMLAQMVQFDEVSNRIHLTKLLLHFYSPYYQI